jgi:hypothetical protein
MSHNSIIIHNQVHVILFSLAIKILSRAIYYRNQKADKDKVAAKVKQVMKA